MKNFIVLFLAVLIFPTIGLTQNLNWAKKMGGTSADLGSSIVLDNFGNIYSTGFFDNTVDFDPGTGTNYLTAVGGHDIYIQKLDSAGNFLWAKSMGGTLDDIGWSIAIDSLGNVYSTGAFYGTVDFNPNSGVHNLTSVAMSQDIYIQKLDANGNFIWAKSMGGVNYDRGYGITIDKAGAIYTTGDFMNTADFDPNIGTSYLTTTSAGFQDIFIQKLDANGNFIWAKSMGGTGYDGGSSVMVDKQGKIFTTGTFQDTVDFDPNTGTFNLVGGGSFIQKLDSAGNFLWAKMTASNTPHMALDHLDNIYAIGFYIGTVDFNPNTGTNYLYSNGLYDISILKLDSSGNFIWAKSMGSTGYDMGTSITLDNQGNVYTTGSFQGRVDFDPGPDSSYLIATGNDDIFIQKLDANGNFLWARSMQGTGGSSGGESIAVDNLGNIYTTGFFKDSVDFDPNSDSCYLVSAGNYDIFIQKLRPETNLSINKIEPSNILLYPNPAINQVTLEWTNSEETTPTSKVVIYNALGQVVYQKLASGNSLNINTQDWNPGMYICKLYQKEENIFTEKFVVIK